MPLTHDIGVRIPYPLQKKKSSQIIDCFLFFCSYIYIPSPLSPPFDKGRGFLSGPASAAPFESLFGRAPRRAEGKGHAVRRGSEHSVANPSQPRRRGGFIWRERGIDIPSPLFPPFVKGRGFLYYDIPSTPMFSAQNKKKHHVM